MGPLIFLPLPLPRDASPLFWATLGGMIVVATVSERMGKPRGVALWMALGYMAGLFGVFGRHGETAGLVGAVAGIGLSLAYDRITRR